MNHHASDDERLEDALRARASLAGDAAGGDVLEGPSFGNAYRLGGLRNYGEDLDEDDEALDEGVENEDDGESTEAAR